MQEAVEKGVLYIAVLGYGTVGSGVVEILNANRDFIRRKAGRPVRIKYVLDIREFPGDPVEKILTHEIDDILNDPDVAVVAEVMGGIEPAHTFVKKALLKGKHVVTSNKELVARHGAELFEVAAQAGVNCLFEASVGGGIPIIRPLNTSLTADSIREINGILNGTTNYILTRMGQENRDFQDALTEAQQLGYAEKDPANDVEGADACRKIAILLSLAIGKQVNYENIYTEGISRITPGDLAYAAALGGTVKLVGTARINEDGIFARVAPLIVDNENPLAMVNDAFNAISIKGNLTGEVMFYGQGAGKLPTAGAVVSDVVDCAKYLQTDIIPSWSKEQAQLLPIHRDKVRKLVRVAFKQETTALDAICELLGYTKLIRLEHMENEFAIVTDALTEGELEEKLDLLAKRPEIAAIRNTIRLY